METPRRRRADRYELAIIGSFIINVIYLVMVATGLLRTDGSGLELPLPLSCEAKGFSSSAKSTAQKAFDAPYLVGEHYRPGDFSVPGSTSREGR